MRLLEVFLTQVPKDAYAVVFFLQTMAIKPASGERLPSTEAALHNWHKAFYIRPEDLGPAQDMAVRQTGAGLRVGTDYIHTGPCVLCGKPPVTWTPCDVLFDPEDAEIIEGRPLCVRCKDIEVESLYEKIALRVNPPTVWDRLDSLDI